MNQEVFTFHPTLTFDDLTLKAISVLDEVEIEELCGYYPPERRISTKALIAKVEKEYRKKNGINWGIYKSNKLVGTIGFYRGFENDQGELGYVLLEKYRGLGIGTSCVKKLVQYGLNQMNLAAIEAYTGIENIPSQKLLSKTGFHRINHSDPQTAAFRIEE